MKAIAVRGGQLVWEDAPDPACGPGQVRINVKAAGVNRADLLQAAGGYPAPPGTSPILGLEAAGIIDEVGAEVTGWRAGDMVCTLLRGGGYAESVVVDHRMPHRLCDDWSFVEGAAVPEAWYTAFVNLFLEGGLKQGETVLIHAGASGVGLAAIQLSVDAGARPLVTVGSPQKAEFCRGMGAELAVDYKSSDFAEEVMAATAGRGVDVILDCVGGSYLPRNISVLARFGRLVQIGLLGGPKGELNLAQVLTKRLRLVGSTLRSRPIDEQVEIKRAFESRFWEGLSNGKLRIIVDRVFPISEAGEAHRYVAGSNNTGKVILRTQS